MTDTDSLHFSCETADIYQDIKASLEDFYTSDNTKECKLFSDLNKKIVDKWKDETNEKPISECVGLRSKMYSFVCDRDREEKRAKAIEKVTVKKDLKHAFYRTVVFEETSMISSITSLRSHNTNCLVKGSKEGTLCFR